MIKKKFTLEHLGCASCAQKMEKRIKKLPGIQSAEIVFPLKQLILETEDAETLAAEIPQIRQIIKSMEPNVRLSEIPVQEFPLLSWFKVIGEHKTLVWSVGLFIASFLTPGNQISLFLLFAAYLLAGGKIILAGFRNLLTGSVFDENLLMTLATLSAWGIGEPHEAAAVMIFFTIGEIFEDRAVDHSRRSIKSLLKLKSETATLYANGLLIETAPEKVRIGDILLVKPGERVPLDGTVLEGESMADTSAITGESVPRNLKPGDTLYSGFINQTGSLKVRVDKPYAESTVNRIMTLVENAAGQKANTEKFITRFARIYTPAVVGIALLMVVVFPMAHIFTLQESIYKAAVFLVISCPCALVVSVPLAFFGGIGAASRHGILVKGGNHLETLGKAKTMLFDKTGTLTKGSFKIAEIHSVAPFTKDDILRYGAHVESRSNHPIARSILEAYPYPVEQDAIEDFQEVSGRGVQALIDGRLILAGNARLLNAFHVLHEAVQTPGTLIYIAVDNRYAGHIIISDALKNHVVEGLSRIRYEGVQKIVMVTGDRKDISENLADFLKIDAYHADLLPEEKLHVVNEYAASGIVAFVGDGINDAPALAASSVGVSMGALGSDAAIEASDIVIMDDDVGRIATAVKIAKTVRLIVWENIVIALLVKVSIMGLSIFGLANMWAAVFADVGMAVLAVLNSIRIVRKKY